jgi:putative addiction module killer protein
MNKTLYITTIAESRIRSFQLRQQRLLYQKVALMAKGHMPDVKSLGNGLLEMRLHSSPGLRVYFSIRDDCIWLLLVGTKHTQHKDIQLAHKLRAELV